MSEVKLCSQCRNQKKSCEVTTSCKLYPEDTMQQARMKCQTTEWSFDPTWAIRLDDVYE